MHEVICFKDGTPIYKKMCCNHNGIYFLYDEFIDFYNWQFKKIETIQLSILIKDLCFDKAKKCFYGIDFQAKIYIFDLHFNILCCYCIESIYCKFKYFQALCCNQCNHLILIFKHQMIELNLNHCDTYKIIKQSCCNYLDMCHNFILYQNCRTAYLKVNHEIITSIPYGIGCICYHDVIYVLCLHCCRCYLVEIKCFKPCHKDKCDNIISSIAQIEASLACILNGEGLKIQKAIELCHDPCCLIKVNESVKDTINEVTCLEQVLLSKLKEAKKM